MITDARDLPFVRLIASFSFMIPFAVLLFVPGMFRWWLAVIYLVALFTLFFDRAILMLHNTSHRALFKQPFRFMNHYIPWFLGPLFGQPPGSYVAHHLGMHHPENNLESDLSSTMPYQRDSFLHFLHYWSTFMVTTFVRLTSYLWAHERKKLAYRVLTGEILFHVGCGLGLWLAPAPTFVVFVIPYLVVRFLMMWGNWGQHAFIDAGHPENPLLNSVTCINSRYNRRCFNDGYHIGHHVKATRHWTELPQDFENSLAEYDRQNAIVFEGIDFFQVSLYLFLKRYDWLAGRFVECGNQKRSQQEIIEFLKLRTSPVRRDVAVTQAAA